MAIEQFIADRRFLAIDASRQFVSVDGTGHAGVVVRQAPSVPESGTFVVRSGLGKTDDVDGVTELTERAAAGDRWALGELVRRTQADVWRLCTHLVDRQAADDLTQESFLRIVKALPAFRSESSGRTYILSIARRTCMDELRRRTRRRALMDRAVDQFSREVVDRDPMGSIAIDALIDALPVDRREAFVCTQLLGLGYAETAEICGCPVGTIRSRVARAREDLADALGEMGDDEEMGGTGG